MLRRERVDDPLLFEKVAESTSSSHSLTAKSSRWRQWQKKMKHRQICVDARKTRNYTRVIPLLAWRGTAKIDGSPCCAHFSSLHGPIIIIIFAFAEQLQWEWSWALAGGANPQFWIPQLSAAVNIILEQTNQIQGSFILLPEHRFTAINAFYFKKKDYSINSNYRIYKNCWSTWRVSYGNCWSKWRNWWLQCLLLEIYKKFYNGS